MSQRDFKGKQRALKSRARAPVRQNARALAMRRRDMPMYRQPTALYARSGEVNALDLPYASYGLSSTAVITCLNLIRVGSTYVNRTGRRVEMKSIRVRGNIDTLRTSIAEDMVRIMVVYDRQTNGAFPTIQDILASTDQAAANTTTSYSNANLNNRDRFQILRDWWTMLPPLTLTVGQVSTPGFTDPVRPTFVVDFYVKLKGLIAQFKADSSPAVIGDIATGGLFLVTYGNVVFNSEGYTSYLETRLRFTDTH